MLSDEELAIDGDESLDEIVQQNAVEEKQQIIEENLKQIKFTQSKLRFAQECYYGNKGKSPLTRFNNAATNEDVGDKAPVHTRLGKRLRLRTVPVSVSTDTIMPKNRRILRFTKKDINTRGNSGRYLRLFKSGLAQQRLERIRRQQAEAMQNTQLIQPIGKFRLRRRRLLNTSPFQSLATNYTVQIPNNTFLSNGSEPLVHSIQAELDIDIQSEIERIQEMHVHPSERIQMLPQLPVATRMTLDERFSSFP